MTIPFVSFVGGRRGLAVVLGAVLLLYLFSSCAGAPVSTTEPSKEETPEIVEIRAPVLLPPRVTIIPSLPEPLVPKSAQTIPPMPERVESVSSAPTDVLAEKPSSSSDTETKAAAKPTVPEKKPAVKAPSSKAAPLEKNPAPSSPSEKPSSSESSRDPALPLPSAPASTALSVAPLEPEKPERTEESTRGAVFELPFKGSGWVYLGETSGRDGIKYESRRFDGTSAVFQFTAEKAGEYVLRFQRQNPVSGEPESLLVKVTVREPNTATEKDAGIASSEKVVEKSTPPITKDASSEEARASSDVSATPQTSTETPSTSSQASSTDSEKKDSEATVPRELPSTPLELLKFARDELAATRIASTLEALDKYTKLFPYGSDEAFYLYAKAYEQNTPYRDIKKAYGYYKRLRDEWPRSPFWKEAADRAMYIERHYFEIR